MPVCQQVTDWINQWAPPDMAEAGDRIGLQVGSPDLSVDRILVTLDLTAAVVKEAIEKQVQLVVSHHPLIYQPLTDLRFDRYPASLGLELAGRGIGLFVAHTNLDTARGGVNDLLAEMLQLREVSVLAPTLKEKLFKLAVFIPRGFEDQVREAVCAAGAGGSGKYSECSFRTGGTGTFRPQQGANPFIGEVGGLEQVDEVRLETIVPEGSVQTVLQAMLRAHPYEEVAYDLYPLWQGGRSFGLGRVGNLPRPRSLIELVRQVKNSLGLKQARYVGEPRQMIRRVALCGGSAMDFADDALRSGADLYLTGDIKHHKALEAAASGMALIDAGHYGSEHPIVPAMACFLRATAQREGLGLEVFESEVCTDPFNYI